MLGDCDESRFPVHLRRKHARPDQGSHIRNSSNSQSYCCCAYAVSSLRRGKGDLGTGGVADLLDRGETEDAPLLTINPSALLVQATVSLHEMGRTHNTIEDAKVCMLRRNNAGQVPK